MHELITPSIDVVIPVYNAPVLTKHCIDSVITHLGKSIQKIIIQDDASDTKTRNMLDDLHYESTQVYHAKENNGFGKSVNEAIGRSEASYVLVLNSDTIVRENFLPSLCLALETDPQLAVIIPSGNHYSAFNLDQYARQTGNYILTHRLTGYAFLIRRSVFQEIGGFDSVFGRGYYEDIDLGRRLNHSGWRIGVSPNSYIYHKGGGSFGRNLTYLALKKRSRDSYFSRYPQAKKNILLISGNCQITDFPVNVIAAIKNIFEEGGGICWFTPRPTPQLYCIHMTHTSMTLDLLIRLFLFGLFRKDKLISEIWILPNASYLKRTMFSFLGRLRGIKVSPV